MAGKKFDIGLVVDRSSSLDNYKNDINSSLVEMLRSLKETPELTGLDTTFTMVSFASDKTNNVDFVPLQQVRDSQLHLEFGGATNPAPALDYVVNTTYNRYREWRDNDEEAFHPLVFFFSDGLPYPEKSAENYNKVAAQIKSLVDNKKVLLICCGFGNANKECLCKITKPEYVVMIKKGNIEHVKEFFGKIIAQTTPYQTIVGKDLTPLIELLAQFSADTD